MTGIARPPVPAEAIKSGRVAGGGRIALVGIDGSGKSTVAEALRDDPAEPPIRIIRCPDFHENTCRDEMGKAPFGHLSRSLKAVGVAADARAIPALKAASLYLRMTLCGPFEATLSGSGGARRLVERHPVVETLVYAPLYGALSRRSLPPAGERAAALDAVLAHAETLEPGAHQAFYEWCSSEERRVGVGGDPWSIIGDLADVLAAGTAPAVEVLERRYRSTLPDTIVWLDAAPALAAARCRASGPVEMHEDVRTLTDLRGRYPSVLDDLVAARPSTLVATIPVDAAQRVDDVARVLRELVGIR